LDQAVRINPRYADPYRLRAAIWRSKQNPDRALADLDSVIALEPNNAFNYAERGSTWHLKWSDQHKKGIGDRGAAAFGRAMQDFEAAIRLDPKFADTYNRRGNMLSAKGDVDGALADYSTAIGLNPNDPAPYHNRCLVRRRKSDLDGALADCSAAIRLDA